MATDPADFAFVGIFIPEVARSFDSLLLFGRTEPVKELGEFELLSPEIDVVELPHYRDLRQLHQVARALSGTVAGFWRGLARVDVVWVFGPHPFGLIVVALAVLRRRRVVLGIRQDTIAYYRSRMPSRIWAPALLPVYILDRAYRLLARRVPAVVTGPAIARRYRRGRRVHPMIESVVRADDVAAAPKAGDWSSDVVLFTVGRLDPEKNPLLLVEAMARLDRDHPGRFRLSWVGGGPLEDAIRRRAEELGVADRIDLLGFIPFGEHLFELYRNAHAFVHVSFTEGVPKVLIEALAAGTPIVATDVGGVRETLDDGQAGLLVPADDLDALVNAIEQLAADDALRTRLATRGLELARERTLEEQSARVAAFIDSTPSAAAPAVRQAV